MAIRTTASNVPVAVKEPGRAIAPPKKSAEKGLNK
jgi:hypothetical protein